MCLADLILIISLRGTADAPVDPPCGMMDSFIQEMSEDVGVHVCTCVSLCVDVWVCVQFLFYVL